MLLLQLNVRRPSLTSFTSELSEFSVSHFEKFFETPPEAGPWKKLQPFILPSQQSALPEIRKLQKSSGLKHTEQESLPSSSFDPQMLQQESAGKDGFGSLVQDQTTNLTSIRKSALRARAQVILPVIRNRGKVPHKHRAIFRAVAFAGILIRRLKKSKEIYRSRLRNYQVQHLNHVFLLGMTCILITHPLQENAVFHFRNQRDHMLSYQRQFLFRQMEKSNPR